MQKKTTYIYFKYLGVFFQQILNHCVKTQLLCAIIFKDCFSVSKVTTTGENHLLQPHAHTQTHTL